VVVSERDSVKLDEYFSTKQHLALNGSSTTNLYLA